MGSDMSADGTHFFKNGEFIWLTTDQWFAFAIEPMENDIVRFHLHDYDNEGYYHGVVTTSGAVGILLGVGEAWLTDGNSSVRIWADRDHNLMAQPRRYGPLFTARVSEIMLGRVDGGLVRAFAAERAVEV